MKEGVEFSDVWRVESFPVKLLKYFPPGGSGTQVKLDKYFKTLYSRIKYDLKFTLNRHNY